MWDAVFCCKNDRTRRSSARILWGNIKLFSFSLSLSLSLVCFASVSAGEVRLLLKSSEGTESGFWSICKKKAVQYLREGNRSDLRCWSNELIRTAVPDGKHYEGDRLWKMLRLIFHTVAFSYGRRQLAFNKASVGEVSHCESVSPQTRPGESRPPGSCRGTSRRPVE